MKFKINNNVHIPFVAEMCSERNIIFRSRKKFEKDSILVNIYALQINFL